MLTEASFAAFPLHFRTRRHFSLCRMTVLESSIAVVWFVLNAPWFIAGAKVESHRAVVENAAPACAVSPGGGDRG